MHGEGNLSTSMPMVVRGGKCTMQHGKIWSFWTERANVQHVLLHLLKCRYFTACHLIQLNSPLTGIGAQSTPSSHYYVITLCSQYSIFKQGLYRQGEREKSVNRRGESTFDVSKTIPFVLISAS